MGGRAGQREDSSPLSRASEQVLPSPGSCPPSVIKMNLSTSLWVWELAREAIESRCPLGVRFGWRALSRLCPLGLPQAVQGSPPSSLVLPGPRAEASPGQLSCPSSGSKQRPDTPSLGRLQPLNGEPEPAL